MSRKYVVIDYKKTANELGKWIKNMDKNKAKKKGEIYLVKDF